jgi:hypothetical protein
MPESVEVLELSRDEVVQQMDAAARRSLGMSGMAALQEFAHGRLEDPGEIAEILVLADLLADDDPVHQTA